MFNNYYSFIFVHGIYRAMASPQPVYWKQMTMRIGIVMYISKT